MLAMFLPRLLHHFQPALVSPESWWMYLPLPALALAFYMATLKSAGPIFVTRRERFDGADIAHIVYGTKGNLDWHRLLRRIGEHWEILLWALMLFHYVYPAHSDYVPRWLWLELTGRFLNEVQNPDSRAPFRGSLIDENMFAIDLKEWGLENILEQYRARREPKITTVP